MADTLSPEPVEGDDGVIAEIAEEHISVVIDLLSSVCTEGVLRKTSFMCTAEWEYLTKDPQTRELS